MSPTIAGRLAEAGIDRHARGRLGASDHTPAWIVLKPSSTDNGKLRHASFKSVRDGANEVDIYRLARPAATSAQGLVRRARENADAVPCPLPTPHGAIASRFDLSNWDSLSAAFSSCTHTISGLVSANHSSRLASRLLTLLIFNAAP
jgi:hypothetical protein